MLALVPALLLGLVVVRLIPGALISSLNSQVQPGTLTHRCMGIAHPGLFHRDPDRLHNSHNFHLRQFLQAFEGRTIGNP